jgi:hypothetical protein
MGALLGASIDFIHALLMAAWVLGLPLLFWHRFPRATTTFAIQASHALLGECFLTTLARESWQRSPGWSGPHPTSDAWFTVRLAEAIFHLTPSHRSIKLISEALILSTALGVGFRGIVVLRSERRATATR